MTNTAENTDDLISTLTDELGEIKVLRHPLMRVIPWCVYAVLYVGLLVYVLGLRSDFDEKLHDPIFVYEMISVLAISLSAAFCSVWMCIPDMRGQKWMLAVPLTLFSSFVLWLGLKAFMNGAVMPMPHWHHCHSNSLYLGIVPAMTIWFLTMRGKTTCYFRTTVMNVLAVGGLGYLGLRISCGADDMGHISFFHVLPYLVLGIIAGLVARRMYRW